MTILNRTKIEAEIEQGYISRRKHPALPLYILNYTQACTTAWRWNEETMLCRGLVVDEDWNIVARSFRKFFTREQYMQLGINLPTDSEYTVYEKIDGILFEVFQYDGQLVTTTRGSFESDWAHLGTQVIDRKYPQLRSVPPEVGTTLCFELVVPESRIFGLTVVDYGVEEDIIFLGAVDAHTGISSFPVLPGIKSAQTIQPKVAGKDITTILQNITQGSPNTEGCVIYWPEQEFRLKVKTDWYKLATRLRGENTIRRVLEALIAGVDLHTQLTNLPASLTRPLLAQFYHLQMEYNQILMRAYDVLEQLYTQPGLNIENRKEVADFVLTHSQEVSFSVVFDLLDEKDPSPRIWRAIWHKIKDTRQRGNKHV